MAIRDIKPTRSELIELKKRIALSVKGHKLLKMKRDGLIMEFFKLLEEAKTIRQELVQRYAEAAEKIAIAEAVEGSVAVKSASFALLNNPQVTVSRKNLMGVVVPQIQATQFKARLDQRGYGIIGTSPRIDEAAKAYERLLETIVRAAEVETGIKKLLDEIEKTKRRVNALEFKVIPELNETRAFIAFRLEEMERENTFRLKKIKEKGAAAAEAAA
ncbi:MAG: V-type ATP synthase subunit D [Euryarchaeota archaeon]|nr:V-type ATP synthase subunit D [Euryarchaeota archaeon]